MSTHFCDSAVITCIDFRFQKYINDWIAEFLKGKTHDRISIAGSSKNLDFILSQIDISVRLHEIKEVIIIHHEDCGAYGVNSTEHNHTHDLQQTRKKILAKYPHLSIELYYLLLDKTFKKIS